MTGAADNPLEEFAQTREHEYQDPHYHDEDLEMIDDEKMRPHGKNLPGKRKTTQRPPPRRRYYEE